MKTDSKISIALLSIALIAGACKKEDIKPLNASPASSTEMTRQAQLAELQSRSKFEENLCFHKWNISSFNDGMESRTDQTVQFLGYTLEFNRYHVAFATNKEGSYTGKWNTVTVNGEKKLILDFGFKPFLLINDRWNVATFNATAINMGVPKNGGNAVLNFKVMEEMPK